MKRFLVVDYSKEQLNPRTVLCTDDHNQAQHKFDSLAKNSVVTAVIIYDSVEDTCTKVFIKGNPIRLVNAVEYARKQTEKKIKADDVAKEEANNVFDKMARILSGRQHGYNVGHIDPYYETIMLAKMSEHIGTGAETMLKGALVGLPAGPAGLVAGAVVGGGLAFVGMTARAKAMAVSHPNQCKHCKGTGFTGNFHRCRNCEGHGHT